AEKFVRSALAHGERIYRTGDYALYREDGSIECQGRADNQVKVRGYRIELEEVELHLSACPNVASAAVQVWKDEAVGNRLAGYLVAKPGVTLDAREIRRFLQPRLPEYMIPSQFMMLDTMPLTPNGKTDRKALPMATDVAPSEPIVDEELSDDEKLLAKIWCDVLHVPHVSRNDNFFDLGGHSLLLVLMFSRINREFSTNLPITTIFDAQTLVELAKVLRQKVRISSLVPVQTEGSNPPLFMVHSYLLYHGLSSVFGKSQPFYGLRELETDGDMAIGERALRYVADMRSVQPHGPYRVAGWCAAGPLAVEVARQLLLQGEKISLLLLFDAWLPEYLDEVLRAERGRSYFGLLKSKWRSYSTKSREMSAREKLGHVSYSLRRMVRERRDDFYVRHWAGVNRLFKKLRMELPQFMHNTSLKTFAAMREFQAEMMPVRITLVRATESLNISGASEGCGWERVASEGVSVLRAPGDHETMFRGSYLKITGSLVQSAMDAAATSQRDPVTRA
ncbi:MAG: phosphopantetheine-binding protein, partial [Bryocella sp.]